MICCEAVVNPINAVRQNDSVIRFRDRFPADRWQAKLLRPPGRNAAFTLLLNQCSFILGSVPRPIRLPSISIAVRNTPYSAIWCMRYSDT